MPPHPKNPITRSRPESADILIVGAGAAGLMAAIHAGRAARGRRIVVLDGAARLGAKILAAGGGRCNVTHDRVRAEDYAGSSRPAIRKVLGRFDVAKTVSFFAGLGVALQREPTGKLFPAGNRAKIVLDALLRAAGDEGAVILHPRRVDVIARNAEVFVASGEWGSLEAPRLILATGGASLPSSGSDGRGYEFARTFGHNLAPIFPALVPLTLAHQHFLTKLSGVSCDVLLGVEDVNGKRLVSSRGPILLTHFGLSGPAVLDISRYYIEASAAHGGTALRVDWLPGLARDRLQRELVSLGGSSVAKYLSSRLAARLAEALLKAAGIGSGARGDQLRKQERRALESLIKSMALPVAGHRGFAHAETTAGGVPLREIRLENMESRLCPGLHLCGEICDVDGRIGGFNFQWAWSSGYVAGDGAGKAAR